MYILLQVGWFGGWLFGIIGFFNARKALSKLRQLRATLAETEVHAVTSADAAPVAPVPVGPEHLDVGSVSPVQLSSAMPSRDLEALPTTSWGIWLGSAALLLAGVFLVRHAVEQGLLGPAARCGLTALLGCVLLLAAEFLQRHEGPPLVGPFRIDQAPSGLAAGGTAMLFEAAYGSGPFYGLLPPLLAFAAMAVASLIALTAALRNGPLTAATGVVGAFGTPALVATHVPSLPGVFAYLLIVSAAALLVVRRTAWTWLSWATTIAGGAWVCFAAFPATPDRRTAAAFVPAAAALNLLLPDAALESGRPAVGLGPLRSDRRRRAGAGSVDTGPGSTGGPVAVVSRRSLERCRRAPPRSAALGRRHVRSAHAAVLDNAGLDAHRDDDPCPGPAAGDPAQYARIIRSQTDMAWAAAALTLTAALTVTAAMAARENDRQRAGIHAAGAVAALAFSCVMLLHDYWLTLAVALFLPPLAWIEARAELPALRHVALAVAAVVIVRLVFNWYVLDYAFGTMWLANGLLAGYAAPAASFAVASLLFRRRGDDRLVATLEAGAVTFLALFIALEIRHGSSSRIGSTGTFTEATLHLLTIAIQATAYLYLARRNIAPGNDTQGDASGGAIA